LVLTLVVLFMVTCSVYFESVNGFNTISKAIECLILSSLAVVYYIKEIRALNDFKNYNRAREGLLVINAAILVLFSGQFFIYLMSNYMLEYLDSSRRIIIWIFNGILNLLFYSIIFIGLWKLASRTKSFSGSY
jgi:4-amino-4-deoxy-L-arabinose transferase-like glycosyltransferase